MKVLVEGHKYVLDNIKSDDGDVDVNILKFYDASGENREEIIGTSNQEVLRALIDRVKFLDRQLPHVLNSEIIHHLRKALVLHESRHLDRLADKGVEIENYVTANNGHFCIVETIEDGDANDGNELKMNVHFRKHLNFPPELNPNHVERKLFNEVGDYEGDNWPTTPEELRKFIRPLRKESLKGAYTDKEGVTKDIKDIDTLSMVNVIDNTKESIDKAKEVIALRSKEVIDKEDNAPTTLELEFIKAMVLDVPKLIPDEIKTFFVPTIVSIKINDDEIKFDFIDKVRNMIPMRITKEHTRLLYCNLYDFFKSIKQHKVEAFTASKYVYKFDNGKSIEYQTHMNDFLVEDYKALLLSGQPVNPYSDKLLERVLSCFASEVYHSHNDHMSHDGEVVDKLSFSIFYLEDNLDQDDSRNDDITAGSEAVDIAEDNAVPKVVESKSSFKIYNETKSNFKNIMTSKVFEDLASSMRAYHYSKQQEGNNNFVDSGHLNLIILICNSNSIIFELRDDSCKKLIAQSIYKNLPMSEKNINNVFGIFLKMISKTDSCSEFLDDYNICDASGPSIIKTNEELEREHELRDRLNMYYKDGNKISGYHEFKNGLDELVVNKTEIDETNPRNIIKTVIDTKALAANTLVEAVLKQLCALLLDLYNNLKNPEFSAEKISLSIPYRSSHFSRATIVEVDGIGRRDDIVTDITENRNPRYDIAEKDESTGEIILTRGLTKADVESLGHEVINLEKGIKAPKVKEKRCEPIEEEKGE